MNFLSLTIAYFCIFLVPSPPMLILLNLAILCCLWICVQREKYLQACMQIYRRAHFSCEMTKHCQKMASSTTDQKMPYIVYMGFIHAMPFLAIKNKKLSVAKKFLKKMRIYIYTTGKTEFKECICVLWIHFYLLTRSL